MAYTKTNWVNDSSPYIDAANLNKIEQGIEDAHNMLGFTDADVRATLMTGLIPINGTPTANDSLLVAIGKLMNGTIMESFDVATNSGWSNISSGNPEQVQNFRKKNGVVLSSALYSVADPASSGATIATLPTSLRPSYQVSGIAYAQIQGQSSFLPVPFTLKTNGELSLVEAPPTSFGLIIDINYFV